MFWYPEPTVKTKKPCRFAIYSELCSILTFLQKVVKKRTSNVKVYYIIPLNYFFTGHPENFKIKLYCFQERLSLRYNIILKLCLHFICVSSAITNFQRTFLLKSILKVEDSLFYFLYYRSKCLWSANPKSE